MDVLVSSAWSNKGADKRSTIFISLHLQSLFSLHQLSESTSISWFLPSLLFFSILSSMSFLDSRLAIDLGPANPTKQTSQEYGDLGQRRQYADINATAVLRAILPRLGPTGTKWRYASSPHARAAKARIFLSTWSMNSPLGSLAIN